MRIASLKLCISETEALPYYLRRERQQAIDNLLAENSFQPLDDSCGPYALTLSIEESRLVLRMRNAAGHDLNTLVLSLTPYRRLIQDYFLMLESYEKARRDAPCEKLEAIDMARRAIHNEGAGLLRARLEGKIRMDHETARRLFTLLCVLHKESSRFVV